MKKYLLPILILFLCPFFFCGCGEKQNISTYSMEIDFDNKEKKLFVKQNVNYINNSSNAFTKICFHLYPNAFREDAKKKPVSGANFSNAYPNGESFGGIDIESVFVSKSEVNFLVEGEDKNILYVPLSNKLFPDESVEILINYSVSLPNVHHRFGYGDDTINIANFYPIACVYEEGKGFKTDLYSSNGDPFYSDVANYNVKVTYDKSLSIASSGEVVSSKSGKKVETTIKANRVRDFAVVFSPKFKCENEKVNGVDIKYFYYDDIEAKNKLEICKNAFVFFDEKFGKYPYKQLSIVQSDFVYGGMEYPNLVLISDALSTESANYVIVHEIAHQWWYGVVGNDEFNEAWVDESLTEYSTVLFFENHEQYDFSYETLVANANSSFKFYYDIYKSVCNEVNTSMARNLNEFDTEPEYIHSVYTQGVIMYDSLREIIGEKRFYKCCQKYFEKMAYKNASGAELISIFSKASGRNLESFFESYLQGKVMVV